MNKYVVRTSLVWLAVIALLAAAFELHIRGRQAVNARPGRIEPVATGPDSATQTSAPAMDAAMDEPLAPLQLSPEAMQSIGVKTSTAEYRQLSSDIRATGTVDIDERLLTYVQIRFPGYIRQVFANATFLYVRKGQPLFTVYSPDLVQTQKEYLLAQRNQYQLRGSSIDGVKTGAASMSSAAEDRLRQWAIPETEIARLEQTGKPTEDMTINSPASGYIVERNALPNMFADLSTRLYTIADLSRVWVNAQIFQNDAGRIREGDEAEITVDTYPGQVFRGRIESILPQVDTATRTTKVRIAVMNHDLKLKPGMFVNADVKTNLGRKLVVPASAVFQSGLRQIAFLDRGNGNLVPREISVGEQVGDLFVVTKGLEEHDRIVASANFLIDSESQIEAASGTSTAASRPEEAAAPSAPAMNIDFASSPNPPHKGPGNQLTIKVTRRDGTPVTGADVAVLFSMPAMPEMGMAAVNTPAHLSERGAGVYRGPVTLKYGGSFHVTVSVKQNGQLMASRQLTVNAEGGM